MDKKIEQIKRILCEPRKNLAKPKEYNDNNSDDINY